MVNSDKIRISILEHKEENYQTKKLKNYYVKLILSPKRHLLSRL